MLTRHTPREILLTQLSQLPNKIQDAYTSVYDMPASAAVLRFCKRELFHNIWLLLLDPEFMYAYEHGMIILCGDSIRRRLFPRFFTYAADYPEKYAICPIYFFTSLT